MSEHTSHPAQGLNRLTIAQQISLLAGEEQEPRTIALQARYNFK